jgi:hypothetical protein
MKLLITFAAILAAATPALADKARRYTLDDLKALVAQKAYEEAIAHLGDIAPSERKAEWLDVAAAASAGYVAGLPTDQIVYAIDAIDRAYPQVLKVDRYTKVRGEQGLKGYEACLGSRWGGSECLERAMKFLDADAANAELALGMAKVVMRTFSSKYAAAPFFKRAVSGKAPGAACKDEELKISLVSALAVPKSYDAAIAGRAIAELCWSEHRKTILDQLDEAARGGSAYVRANTCEILKARKALTADQARICARVKDD